MPGSAASCFGTDPQGAGLLGLAPSLALLLLAAIVHGAPAAAAADLQVIAHRGAAGSAPENTLAAVARALEERADWIEIDLRRSADGEPVAMHDVTVGRTTDGRGAVAGLTLAQLKGLDAGGWFGPAFRAERIPTLDEILARVPEATGLILELKEGGTDSPGFEEKVIERLSAAGRRNVILKSFDPAILARLEALAPEVARLYVFVAHLPWLNLIVDGRLRVGNAFDPNAAWLQKHRLFITEGFVRRAQAKGLKVVAWDVHGEDDMRAMMALGVDAIETDHPARLRALLGK